MADNISDNSHNSSLLLDDLDQLSRLYRRCLAARLSPYGCMPGHVEVLSALSKLDNPTQKELLSRVPVEQPTLSKTLGRMERDDIVKRVRDEKDRRITRICLTDKGSRLLSVVSNAGSELDSVVKTGLTFNDIRYFKRVLRQISDSLQSDSDSALLVLTDVLED